MKDFSELQYQSFPDAPGMVDSYAKLIAFKFPDFKNKRFLDIGCNEGYYCGHAMQSGASRAVGLDSYLPFLERARRRFPDVEFVHSSWDFLPDEVFDIVLFSSALHYIKDESQVVALFKNVADRLHSDGIFIVETGINNSGKDWLDVERHDGTHVYYPSIPIFERMAVKAGLVHRVIGVSEPGDGIPRTVIHCNKFSTPVNFVVGPSGIGKTRFCYSLFGHDLERIISVDSVGYKFFKKKYPEENLNVNVYNPLDVYYGRTGPDGLPELVEYIYQSISTAVSQVAVSSNKTSAIIVDGLDEGVHFHSHILNALVAKIKLNHPIWISKRV